MSQSARSKSAAPKTSQKCCAAALCTNRSDNRKYLTFHAFPKDSQRRMEWAVKMKRSDSKFNAPINVKPQGGGGGGRQNQGNLTFSREPESNSPPPGT